MAGREFDNSMSGVLFVNSKKEKDSHPDRTGSGEVDCPHCQRKILLWVSGWIKTAKDGNKLLSLAFRHKEPQNGGNAQASRDYQRQAPARRDDDVF